jgi:hypothetical protein
VAEARHLYFAVRRGGKWNTKKVEDVTEQDLRGIELSRDFMTALTSRDDLDAGIVEIETNLRACQDPFEALREADEHSPGLELLRRIVRAAGYRITSL